MVGFLAATARRQRSQHSRKRLICRFSTVEFSGLGLLSQCSWSLESFGAARRRAPQRLLDRGLPTLLGFGALAVVRSQHLGCVRSRAARFLDPVIGICFTCYTTPMRRVWWIPLILTAGCSSAPEDDFDQGGVSPVTTGVAPGSPNGSSNAVAPSNPSDTDVEPVLSAPPTSPPPGTDPEDCDSILEVTYRDFSEMHPDFEMAFAGDEVRLTLVAPTLDQAGKPIFNSSVGCPWSQKDPRVCNPDWKPTEKVIQTEDSFNQWYRTVEGVNFEFQKEMPLTETGPGTGVFVFESAQFFPLTSDEGFGPTPQNGQMHNYLFTTEIHLQFTYRAKQTFKFRGDDDLWVFINNKLALDLGSMHNPAEGVIDFDAQAADLGIAPNNVYRMDVFHAERHTQVSSFRIETNIGCFTPAPPRQVL
jgi:fibro-slime domain-containing protein